MGRFQSHVTPGTKIERDNGVAPASAHANNSHGRTAIEALNNLAAATVADRQAPDNQAESVANLAGMNQQLAHQLQQSQQQIQKMMENLHLPSTAHAKSYQSQPQKPAPVAAHILSRRHPHYSIKGTQAGSAETNCPAQRGTGTIKVSVPPAASMSQNGTPATHDPHSAAALITTSRPPELTSWEYQRNTEC